MAFYNPSFVFGIAVLLYLSTFIVFAILRILTGISIQRLGYFSLRHINYTPRDGLKVEIRGLGLTLHRPTFAQPTWLSVVITELHVQIDPTVALAPQDASAEDVSTGKRDAEHDPLSDVSDDELDEEIQRSKIWRNMMRAKEQLKQLHSKINYLRMVDLVATNTTVTVKDVCVVQLGHFTAAVDTRRKTVDRSRLFQHMRSADKEQRPAEWILTLRGVLFTADGKESLEVLDYCSLNVYGIMHKELDGLRDAALVLKLGRLNIPYDDFVTLHRSFHRRVHSRKPSARLSQSSKHFEEFLKSNQQDRAERLVQAFSDSNEVISSILRGIQEVQFAVGFLAITKEIQPDDYPVSPVYLNMSLKEFGIDLHRLDQKSPAHRMYFSREDVAHQALLAAISLTASLDDGQGKPERLLYIPMVTTTIKTTLPSKTIQLAEEKNTADRNANILFANMVVTSPSIDLRPRHLPLLLELYPTPRATKSSMSGRRHFVISRLLPKANIRLSIHEPVMRVVLPCLDKKLKDTDEFDLLVSSISSISLEIESSHSAGGDIHYSLASNFRVSTHELYYQAASGMRHDLLLTDALEVKVQVSASPEVHVVLHGNLQTFTLHMVRPETSQGVRQVYKAIRSKASPAWSKPDREARPVNFLRQLPSWLLHVRLEGRNFSVEIAGVDSDVSDDSKGVALQLESWTAEYRAQKKHEHPKVEPRKRAMSRVLGSDDELHHMHATAESRSPDGIIATDGRRLAFHVYGLDGYIVESMETWEPQAFLSVPRLEVAFSASSDHDGPIFHINTHVKSILMQYSLYRHYALSAAIQVLRKTFTSKSSTGDGSVASDLLAAATEPTQQPQRINRAIEFVNIDLKVLTLQVKADLPSDPRLLLQIYNLDAARRRWTVPFVKASLIRLCAQPPHTPNGWARMLNVKQVRLDVRTVRRKSKTENLEHRSVDITSESIRFAIPHQVVLYKTIDNFINTTKAVQQLALRARGGSCEPVDRKPVGPRLLPRVSLRSSSVLFEMEDGPFEWKLGSIYRAGLREQKQRIAREEAFEAKKKKLQESQSHRRAKSAHPRGRTRGMPPQFEKPRSKSAQGGRGRSRSRSLSPGNVAGRPVLRYDPEGTVQMSTSSSISIDEARRALDEYNAKSWKKTIETYYEFQRQRMQKFRSSFIGEEGHTEPPGEGERLLEMPARPSLAALFVSDLHFVLDKPSFPLSDCANFMYRVGKGIPHDTKYCLLVPLHVKLDMGEARVNLRDYPLPLIHVPAIQASQSPRVPAFSLQTNFVIAEEYRDAESSRLVNLEIVPPAMCIDGEKRGGFSLSVRRTVSPVKTYSDMDVAINTAYPTRITWGTAYQPAIQDMMMTIENFTKPQIDPSERAGFWDKIRLVFHSRAKVNWKADGDVHLSLLGSRDPYVITGFGAGFIMCWRNDVAWTINADPDPRKVMTVDSSEYILAVPDYAHKAVSMSSTDTSDANSVRSSGSYKNGAVFNKVIMKLSGNVRWLAGLMFERHLHDGKRTFESKPHYEITFKDPKHAKGSNGRPYDAFEGFRSQFIHMSVAIVAPLNRDWTAWNLTPSSSYNSIHLSPRFFTHFFNWWSMFSAAMSLPIRQGKLWPGQQKTSKKFGRHLTTLKYSILVSPLYISHVYKHKEADDEDDGTVSATGLKAKLDSFMLDIHQRREEHLHQGRNRSQPSKISSMKIHEAEIDLISADIRAIAATIHGNKMDDLRDSSESELKTHADHSLTADAAKFTIPDQDYTWIDLDDFVELNWLLPSEWNPETKIMPLAYTPRFTYFRQTDHFTELERTINSLPQNPFGHEPTHECVMNEDNGPGRVQSHLVQARLDRLEKQMSDHRRLVGEAELSIIKSIDGSDDRAAHEALAAHGEVLVETKDYLETLKKKLARKFASELTSSSANSLNSGGNQSPDTKSLLELGPLDNNPLADLSSDFNNRFIVHNLQLKWNNILRNIILRYIHQVSQRRGFIYYTSRKAVKFILDIIAEQQKARAARKHHHKPSRSTTDPKGTPVKEADPDEDEDVEARIKQLLDDTKKLVSDEDVSNDMQDQSAEQMSDSSSTHNTALNSYHVRLIAPQIQMQSERNLNSAVLLTAKSIQLKVVEIMDKERLFDDVSGLVQRRFGANLDSVQFFVTQRVKSEQQKIISLADNKYGAPTGSSWPPWVPLENLLDFKHDPLGFSRVVRKTSASLRYFKHNPLRLKYNDEVSRKASDPSREMSAMDTQVDEVWVNFPEFKAICDSSQYYSMYMIVLDLLLYSEPLEKVRSERLEKIMLASDFSDLTGAPEMVMRLQNRIRQLEDIKTHLQVHEKHINKRGWEARLLVERDLAGYEDELFFMMKAITSAQRRHDDSPEGTSGLLKWYLSASNIVWHLFRHQHEPLAEFELSNASYERIDFSDGSNKNKLQIAQIKGLNLLKNAFYPHMFGPYVEDPAVAEHRDRANMLNLSWTMLEAIAGIPVMDHFEINLFPIKIQLEKDAGKKLFDYVFPGANEDSEDMLSPPTTSAGDDCTSALDSNGATPTANGDSYFGAAAATAGRDKSILVRLKPTLQLSPYKMSPLTNGHSHGHRHKQTLSNVDSLGSQPFKHQLSSQNVSVLQTRRFNENLSSTSLRATDRSMTSLTTTGTSTPVEKDKDRSKKISLLRTATAKIEQDKNADDLSMMLSRASNYMTLAHIKIPSVVLCLSYKGKGDRNIEDVHNFVFRMPSLEYRNKTWSNLDLVQQVKKDVYRALLSHTGAIIGNKFTHKRPKKPGPSQLRDIANASQMTEGPSGRGHVQNKSESSSTNNGSSEAQSSPRSSMNRQRRQSTYSHSSLKSLELSSTDESARRRSEEHVRTPSSGFDEIPSMQRPSFGATGLDGTVTPASFASASTRQSSFSGNGQSSSIHRTLTKHFSKALHGASHFGVGHNNHHNHSHNHGHSHSHSHSLSNGSNTPVSAGVTPPLEEDSHDETEEVQKKSRLLLGKRIFGSSH